MSYILDALKKSEQARAQHHDLETTTKASTAQLQASGGYHLWLWLSVAGIVMLGIVFASYLPAPNTQNSDIKTTTKQPTQQVPLASQKSAIIVKEAPILTKPLVKKTPLAVTTTKKSVSVKEVTPSSNNDTHEHAQSLHELPEAIRSHIPPIHIDAHIYDENAHQRMVIINGNIKREGAWIDNIQLIHITEGGVLMRYNDTYFRMHTFGQ